MDAGYYIHRNDIAIVWVLGLYVWSKASSKLKESSAIDEWTSLDYKVEEEARDRLKDRYVVLM